ncbi:four helix bundle protein [Candidatus Gottesmanbacteria bacterium]|nr:four helix bundle protein [Candidatus Gottesmanbacteria bacterium]
MATNSSQELKQRILRFVLRVINIVKKLPDNRINKIFSDQIIRSASGIGSNYEEADGTPTKKDFIYKMSLVKKESKETKYWLKLIRLTNDDKFYLEIDEIGTENEELIKIFAKIIINANS